MVSVKVAPKQPPVFIMRPIKVKICRDALRVHFPGNWMTLSSPVNFTDGNAAKQTKSFGSLLSWLQVLRLNEFCPSFHNWQRCYYFSPPAASSSKNKLSLLLYLTYLNVQQPGETIFKLLPSKVLFQLNSAADRTNGFTLVGIYLFKGRKNSPDESGDVSRRRCPADCGGVASIAGETLENVFISVAGPSDYIQQEIRGT